MRIDRWLNVELPEFRNTRMDLLGETANIGPAVGAVTYAGPQGAYVGLDQVNIQIPNSLAGRGRQVLTVTVDGQTTNQVQVAFK